MTSSVTSAINKKMSVNETKLELVQGPQFQVHTLNFMPPLTDTAEWYVNKEQSILITTYI